MAEGILLLVVRPPHLRVAAHAPHDRRRAGDEHHLHHRVVERDVVREEVQVPRDEHQHVQLLRLPRHPCAAAPRSVSGKPPALTGGRNPIATTDGLPEQDLVA